MLVEHRTSKAEQDQIVDRFKKEIDKDRLCILIVKDMLLTGFDAKIEAVMYLDRPLKEHTLLQAVARVNRTYTKEIKVINEEGNEVTETRTKAYGFVVDYFGITRHLEEALKIFDPTELGRPMQDIESIFRQMLDYKEAVMRMFAGVKKSDLDALMNVLKPEDKRAEFEMAYKRFASAVNALMPSHARQEDLNDLKWLSYLRAGAKARFEPENPIDISDCGEKAKELISAHLKSEGVYQWIAPITLLEKGFFDKVKGLGSDEAIASSMEHAIKHVISVKMKDNPVHYTSLLERLQKILEETRLSWEERKEQLHAFITKELEHGEEDLAEKLGLSEKRQLAIYETIDNAIKKHLEQEGVAFSNGESQLETVKLITLAIEDVILKTRVKGFSHNQTRITEMETAIYGLLLSNYYETFGFESIQQLVNPLVDLAKIHYDDLE
jgi:type I restriction enzyme R subunit